MKQNDCEWQVGEDLEGSTYSVTCRTRICVPTEVVHESPRSDTNWVLVKGKARVFTATWHCTVERYTNVLQDTVGAVLSRMLLCAKLTNWSILNTLSHWSGRCCARLTGSVIKNRFLSRGLLITLKMEAAGTSETSVNIYHTRRRNILEETDVFVHGAASTWDLTMQRCTECRHTVTGCLLTGVEAQDFVRWLVLSLAVLKHSVLLPYFVGCTASHICEFISIKKPTKLFVASAVQYEVRHG
jgi:hypothetical protein